MSTLWIFRPLDSCFFREAKPFNASEGGFLTSKFPPPAQTLAGSFRSTVGELLDVDWTDYGTNAANPFRNIIGSPDNPYPLSFSGPYVLRSGERLYPAPLHLLYAPGNHTDARQKFKWERLTPGDIVCCDIGEVSLPRANKILADGKLPEKIWLCETDLTAVLNGEPPAGGISETELIKNEDRAGIGRDNQRSAVEEGLLYFVRHLRLHDAVSFAIEVTGMPDDINLAHEIMTRCGGEGRLAELRKAQNTNTLPAAPEPTGKEKGLILTLLTNGDFDGKAAPDWTVIDERLGVALTLVTACTGKPVREGGWDYAQRPPRPKPLKSLVPAGSSYFVTVAGDIRAAVAALHGKKIGNRTEFGYGEIVAGLWND